MTEHPAASGADLARQALAAYKATAKSSPATKPKTRRMARTPRGTGRDPLALGAALKHINTEQGWELSLEGGSILDQWATLCPQYVGYIEPVGYDAEQGRLDLRPCSPAYATQLRVFGADLRKQINTKLGRQVVRSLGVLPVGPVAIEPSSRPAAVRPVPVVEPEPVKTRDTAHPGYRETLAAIRPPTTRTVDAAVLEAIQRQNRATAREPETKFAATVTAMEGIAPAATDTAEQIRQAAIRRKHVGGQDIRTVFGAA